MKFSYYPGCSGHGTGRELEATTRALCDALDVELHDIPDWSCCGASSAHVIDHELSIALSARNLAIAEQQNMDVLTPCPACFSRLAGARKHVIEHGTPADVNKVSGDSRVYHIFDLFSKTKIIEKAQQNLVKSLNGIKVVCYYGCLTSRPTELTNSKNPENPMEMENILSAVGAETIDWPYKTQCCGGSLTLTRDVLVEKYTSEIFKMAKRAGAEAIVTGCPMCFMNLDRQWNAADAEEITQGLPVFYYTELLLLALNPELARGQFKRHLSNPSKLLAQRELI